MHLLDTRHHWQMVSCCPKPWLSLLSYSNTFMWVLERIEICHVYWEEKNVPELEHICFLVFASTLKTSQYCIYKPHLNIDRVMQVLPSWDKIIFISKGNWAYRSVLDLVKFSLKRRCISAYSWSWKDKP